MAKKTPGLTDDLRTAIRETGLTHYRIGKDAGIAPDIIGRFVRGERDLRLETASKICDVLGLKLTKKK